LLLVIPGEVSRTDVVVLDAVVAEGLNSRVYLGLYVNAGRGVGGSGERLAGLRQEHYIGDGSEITERV